ncbi:hypothetical protein BGY98DRAFT_953096, partial [Russula aff. rugulosa BPL654]
MNPCNCVPDFVNVHVSRAGALMLVRQTSKMARPHMVISPLPSTGRHSARGHLKVPSLPCIVFWHPSSYYQFGQRGLQHVAPYRFRK